MWGILENENLSNNLGNYNLDEPVVTIGRSRNNSIIINDNRVSKFHCKIEYKKELNEILLTDLSQNGTYVNDVKVGKDNQIQLKEFDTITILNSKQVQQAFMSFKLKKIKSNNDKRILDEHKLNEEQIIKQQQQSGEKKKNDLEEKLGEEMICTICDDYIYGAITLISCMHNFCGGCYSQWMKKSKICPNCQIDPIGVSKNIPLINIIEKYLESHPEKQKSQQAKKEMDEINIFKNQYHEFKKEPEKKLPNTLISFPPSFPMFTNQYQFQNNLFGQVHPSQYNQQNVFNFIPHSLNQSGRPSLFNPLSSIRYGQNSLFQNEIIQSNTKNVPIFEQSSESDPSNQPMDRSESESEDKLRKIDNFDFFDTNKRPQDMDLVDMFQAIDDNNKANRRNCLNCEISVLGFKCEDNQKHVGCTSCGRLMPLRNITSEQNEIEKSICTYCQKPYCNLFDPTCPKRSTWLCQFDQLPNPIALKYSFFRDNKTEYNKFDQYLKTERQSLSEIIKFMTQNYISKNLFFIHINKILYSNKIDNEREFLLREKTPICMKCADEIWFQIILRYCMVCKDDMFGYVEKMDCWYGINCKTMNSNPSHALQFNHMCEQTKFI